MPHNKPLKIGAVVLAAGLSSRMGVQKLLLPWKGKTVIETVVDTLISSEMTEIVVVTGTGCRANIEIAWIKKMIHIIFNPDFADGNMVTSLVTGLKALQGKVDAVLMVLGDQPQMSGTTSQRITRGRMESESLFPLHSQLSNASRASLGDTCEIMGWIDQSGIHIKPCGISSG